MTLDEAKRPGMPPAVAFPAVGQSYILPQIFAYSSR